MRSVLSIVTPAYNAGKFIEQMIESVLIQPEQVELIIVNDGSTDETEDVCEKYTNIYKNIKVIHTLNRGAGAARNLGLMNAGGGYIIYLDSDDLILSNTLNESFFSYLTNCLKKKIDIILTARIKIDMNLIKNPQITFPQEISEIKNHVPELEFWTGIYRKEFLVSNKIKFFEYKEQDIETAFRYRAFSKAQKIEVSSKHSFYLQRNNPTSNMHTFNHYKLYRIKAQAYYMLSKEEKTNIEDLPYLERVIVENVFRYFRYSKRNGYENIIDWKKKAQDLRVYFFQCFFKTLIVSKNNWKGVFKYTYYVLYLKFFFWKNTEYYLPKCQSPENPINDKVVNVDSTEEILNRLKKVSTICKRKFDYM